ncbi:hypothetical protein NN561_005264 [Cricetulus griseus]
MAPSILACVHTPAWKGSAAEVGAKQSCTSLHGASDLSLACQAPRSACVETGLQPLTPHPLHSTKEPIVVLISWATPEGGQAILNPEHRGRILNSADTTVSLTGTLTSPRFKAT